MNESSETPEKTKPPLRFWILLLAPLGMSAVLIGL